MSKESPRPWSSSGWINSGRGSASILIQEKGTGYNIARLFTSTGPMGCNSRAPTEAEATANACLIAAAPLLLEAAKAALACLKAVYGQQLEGDDGDEPQHSTQLLLATAIAAAEGRTA